MNAAAALFAAAFSYMQVDPYSHQMYLPDTEVTNAPAVLEIDSAIGEIESGSFLVRPREDLKHLDVQPTDLKGPGGAVIPASAVDVKTVKVWWAGWSNWASDRHGRDEPVVLMPNVILHDDGLVKVDLEKKLNYLRVDYADGTRYVDILSTGRALPLKYHLEPFRDAKAFVPIDLPKETTRQFWITVKTPFGARPGLYRGALAFSNGDTVVLSLNVYPFELPLPRTHYDINKRYMSGIMGFPTLGEILARCKNLAEAEHILLNIYTSAAEHNIQFGSGPGDFGNDTTDDLGVRSLFLRYQAGLQMERFTFGNALDHGWYGGSEGLTPEQDRAACGQAIAAWTPYVDRQFGTLRKYLGDTFKLVLCGRSEASVWGVKRQQPFFREVERRGGGTICDTGRETSKMIAWGMTTANVSADSSYTQARRWHMGGGEIVGYYAPSTAIWDPDVWRRRGIRNWFADYDGIFEMAWMHGRNPWNDHIWSGDMYRSECLALPDADGIVCTLSYEGYRELADDIAYFSLHRLLSEKALASDDAAVRAFGRSEWEWLERIEPDRVVDLVAFRREVAKRIVALQEKTGPLPPERWTRKIAALEQLPPCTCTETDPEKLARMDRYDLAVPAAEKRLQAAIKANAVFERVKWASFLATLHCGLLRRDLAIKVLDREIDDTAKNDGLKAVLAELLQSKLATLLTDMYFEEIYTEAQLEEAIACLDRLMKTPGGTPSMKFGAFDRLARTCNESGFPKLAAKVLDAASTWVAGLGNDPHKSGWHLAVELQRARTYQGLGEWRRAIQVASGIADHPDVDRAAVGKVLGECGEKAEDWTSAAIGYNLVIKTIAKESIKERKHWQQLLDRATSKLRGSQTGDPSGGMDASGSPRLGLDEED